MSKHKLPKVNCKYGAPMGRTGNVSEPDATVTFNLKRVTINSQGYDEGGAYWGTGEPLYWAFGEGTEEVQEMFTRAQNRTEAKRKVLLVFPNARWKRSKYA